MNYKQLAFGIATFVPGVYGLVSRGEQDSRSARYCYSVWLRHLIKAWHTGLDSTPSTVMEMGPGGSLGTSLASLLCGTERVFALDVAPHAGIDESITIMDEIAVLLGNKEAVPHSGGFAKVKPSLAEYSFPEEMLNDERLGSALSPERMQSIRDSLQKGDGRYLRYIMEQSSASLTRDHGGGFVDMVFSQAVMEYVPDIEIAYKEMFDALKPGGFVSHQIDLRSHNTHEIWNGHWTYSDLTWRLLRGGRPYGLNREPLSRHVQALKSAGFEIVCQETVHSANTLSRTQLAARFQELEEKDLTTSGVFIQARKP